MMRRYIFECLHIDCSRNHGAHRCDVPTLAQVRQLFKDHASALHFCRYYEVKDERKD